MRMKNEDQWKIYQDRENAWHWKKTAPAGQILEKSALDYSNRTECLNNARLHGYIGN